jgi:tetratricopeptide (TPR) repeat protein
MDYSIREKDFSANRGYRKKDKTYTVADLNSAKRRRRSRIDYRKVVAITLGTVVIIVAGFSVYNHLPFVKVNKAIAAGNKYSANEDYESAINSYSEAIEIDSGSVAAYSNMAGAYLSIDDSESAKKVLYDGWQNTESEALLDNYHTVILNDVVNTINRQEATIDSVLDIVSVLETDSTNKDAIELLDAAHTRCFAVYGSDVNSLFRSSDSSENYRKYEEIVTRLLTVYQDSPSDELKNLVVKYAVPSLDSFTMNYDDAVSYATLLSKVDSVTGFDKDSSEVSACLNDTQSVLSVFTGIFEQLDIGNVDELRDFIVTDEYVTLRNKYLNQENTPLENTTYIPISRDGIVLNRSEEGWSYRFLSFEENPDNTGVITLWANYFEDNGVQRNSISYEPASIDGNLYPHTKYSVTYLNSYITSGKSTKVEKMNYRLDTTITYEDGTVDETIVGDWGGANEWIMDIDTIESRIRA